MLKVPESEATQLEALTGLLEALREADMISQVSSIRLGSTQMVLRYLNRFDVKIKLNADFDYSIRLMQTVREWIEENYSVDAAGSIDLTQENYSACYSPAEPAQTGG